jgi:hypothetical protein
MLVGGTWYRVDVSDADMTVSAEDLDLKTGSVQLDREQWSVMLVGKTCCFRISGGTEPIQVPADSYIAVGYTEHRNVDDGRRAAQLTCGSTLLWRGQAKEFLVEAGKTTKLEVGEPLKGHPTADVNGRNVQFGLRITDVSGAKLDWFTDGQMSGPGQAEVKVLGPEGNPVYTCALEYS